MKIEGNHFKNSDTCNGVAYRADAAPLDIAPINISGRYPESGWAVNEITHEMVYVQSGVGSLAIKEMGIQPLVEGDAVSIAPGQRFAWDGDMKIIMACYPPFSPDQYKLEEDDEV